MYSPDAKDFTNKQVEYCINRKRALGLAQREVVGRPRTRKGPPNTALHGDRLWPPLVPRHLSSFPGAQRTSGMAKGGKESALGENAVQCSKACDARQVATF